MKSVLGDSFYKSIYILFTLSITFCFHQIGDYLISVTAKSMQVSQGWGDGEGTGVKYDFLAGPVFTSCHIISSLPIGYVLDKKYLRRSTILTIALLLWSISIVLTGYSTKYWQVVTCRMWLAVATSVTNPVSASLISDYFPSQIRSSAFSIYNFAIYFGFSLTLGVGNMIESLFNWRYVWFIFGYLGIIWSIFVYKIPDKIDTNNTNKTTPKPETKDTQDNISTNIVRKGESFKTSIDLDSTIDLTDEFKDENSNNKLSIVGGTVLRDTNVSSSNNIMSITTKHSYTDTHKISNTNDNKTKESIDENKRNNNKNSISIISELSEIQKNLTLSDVIKFFISSPSLMLLLLVSLYRNSGGYVWAYQANNYFRNVRNESRKDRAKYLGWVPGVGGSIGCLLGGVLSDKIVKDRPAWMRIWILVVANILSFPFSTGTLILRPPYCYFSLFIMYFFSEAWISICVTLVVEFSPSYMKGSILAIYYFSIGWAGFAPQLVTPVQKAINSYKYAVWLLWSCVYGTSGILFLFVLLTFRRDIKRKRTIVVL